MAKSLTTNKNVYLDPILGQGETKPLSLMDRLFNRLDGIYPHKWRSAFASEQAIQNWRDAWSDAFLEERLAPSEIKTGLAACRKQFEWPPSLPEFLKICRPNLEPELAWHEAVRQMARRAQGRDIWSHPAIYWTAIEVGEFDLKNLTYLAIKARWCKALDANLRKDLPPPPPRLAALPAPGMTAASMDEARRKVQEVCRKFAKSKEAQNA